VTDSTAYKYNAELRKMVKDLKLTHIAFVRVQDLISSKDKTGDIVDMSEDDYVVQAPKTREAFLATDIDNWNVEEQIKTDEGTLRTYRGYLRFLKLDLEDRQTLPLDNAKEGASFRGLSRKAKEKIIGNIAKKMMGNGAVSIIAGADSLATSHNALFSSASPSSLESRSPPPSALASTLTPTLDPSLPFASSLMLNSLALQYVMLESLASSTRVAQD
jgi:hypothetical protein